MFESIESSDRRKLITDNLNVTTFMSTQIESEIIESSPTESRRVYRSPRSLQPTRGESAIRSGRDSGIIDALLLKMQSFQSQRNLGSLCIGFTSCKRGTGVSTVVTSLALRASSLGLGNCLVLDGNLLHPRMHSNLAVGSGKGFVDAISTESADFDVSDFIQKTGDPDLDVMTAGSSALKEISLSPNALTSLFNELRTRYQTIFVDMGAFDEVGPGFFLACSVDAVAIVIDPNSTRSRDCQRLIDLFLENDIEVMGSVINRYQSPLPRWIKRWL